MWTLQARNSGNGFKTRTPMVRHEPRGGAPNPRGHPSGRRHQQTGERVDHHPKPALQRGPETLSFSHRGFRPDPGFIYGAFYALLIFSMSGGLLGTSTPSITRRRRPLDPSGECQEVTDEPWIHIYPDNDNERFSIGVHNLPPGIANVSMTSSRWTSSAKNHVLCQVDENFTIGNGSSARCSVSTTLSGPHELSVRVDMQPPEGSEEATVEGEWPISNDLSVELSTSSATLSFPFVDDSTTPRPPSSKPVSATVGPCPNRGAGDRPDGRRTWRGP